MKPTVNILVVDDQTLDRIVLKRLLSRFPECTVHEAADGEAGLEKVTASSPALIFCDLSMPKLDGVGFVTGLRSNPAFLETPVIITSAGKDRDVLIQLRDLGIADYLLKPYELKNTFERIERHLRPLIIRHETAMAAAAAEARVAAQAKATEAAQAAAEARAAAAASDPLRAGAATENETAPEAADAAPPAPEAASEPAESKS
jgi:two-component system chemotaxis response regulator CheY